jgi:Flp pilus assembly protein CpaB
MLKRLANSGLNLAVIIMAVVVFLLAFFALNGLAAARKPPILTVLAASRDLQIGEVITAADLVEKTVYEDDNAPLYIPVGHAEEVIGGVVALPLRAGQPLLRDMVVALAGAGYRLSAALSQFPDHSLFPITLDASNLVAPAAASFLPGDLIGVTVVLGSRPQPPATSTPNAYTFISTPVITGTRPVPRFAVEREEAEAQARVYPPLAKDLFPQGVLVIAVQGIPQTTITGEDPEDLNSPPVFAGVPQQKQLILLVPNQAREQLALALQRADQVFVSLLVRNEGHTLTPGFTYWDFEDLFKADRERFLNGSVATRTPAAP